MIWWAHSDSNQEPSGYEPLALPLSYGPTSIAYYITTFRLRSTRLWRPVEPQMMHFLVDHPNLTAECLTGYNAVGQIAMVKVPEQYEKEAYVKGLFSSIADKYDLMNSVISLNRHRAWRRFAVSKAGLNAGDSALDVCCGTGDFTFELARAVGSGGRVIGTDFSQAMIELARAKSTRRGMLDIEFLTANTCELPFPDESFDCVTVGFGVRNLANIDAGLSEMSRVLKPGGRLVCLETGEVRIRLVRPFWRLFFYGMTPLAAGLMGAKKWAYEYLPESAKRFLTREELADRFRAHKLQNVAIYDLMFGAVCVHVGTKVV